MNEIKVLLVDDEKDFVDILSQRLIMRGFSTTVVYRGEEAISCITKEYFHIIVLDVKMPGMTGVDILKWIKEKNYNVEIIMLTGYSSEKEENEIKRLGVFEFLRKPPDFNALVKLIKCAYDKIIKKED